MSKTYSKETNDKSSLLGAFAEILSLGFIKGDSEYTIKVEEDGKEKVFKYDSESERDNAFNNMQNS